VILLCALPPFFALISCLSLSFQFFEFCHLIIDLSCALLNCSLLLYFYGLMVNYYIDEKNWVELVSNASRVDLTATLEESSQRRTRLCS